MRKIALDSLDADEFEKLAAEEILEDPDNPNLAYAFSLFRQWVGDQKLPDLGTFLYRLKNQAIVIRLDVSEAKDAFKLFETINNRGLKLSPTDIIKNFILGNAARLGGRSVTASEAEMGGSNPVIWMERASMFFCDSFSSRGMKKRVTASYVIQYFKAVSCRAWLRQHNCPSAHWYTDDKETEGGGDEENAELGIEQPTEIKVSDKHYVIRGVFD